MSVGTINPGAVLPQNNNQIAAAAKPEVAQPKSQVEREPVKIPAVEEKMEIRPDTEGRRFSRVADTAKRMATEFFPINDTRFTIFKDGSGQYITRFTNLKDGTVTFYPEPDLFARMGGIPDSLYTTNA